MRARTRYRLSMRRPISGSVNVEATPEVYAETRSRAPRGGCVSLVVLLHVTRDRGDIVARIGGEPVLRDRTRALVVCPDRVLEVGGEVRCSWRRIATPAATLSRGSRRLILRRSSCPAHSPAAGLT